MQGEWGDEGIFKCWHIVELEADQRHVVVHLGEVGGPILLRVRRKLSDEHDDLSEQVALARAGLAQLLRDIADKVDENPASNLHELLAAAVGQVARVRTLPDSWRAQAAEVHDQSSPTLLVNCAEELEQALEIGQ